MAESASSPSAQCVLTGHSFAEAAPIMAYATKTCPPDTLDYILQFASFWGDTMIDQSNASQADTGIMGLLENRTVADHYKALFKNTEIMESSQNRLSLDPHLDALWAAGRFGLKPLPATGAPSTGGSVRVQFQ